MKLKNLQNKLELIIENELLDRLGNLGIKNYPNEFGGFLIGNYSSDLKTVFVNNYLLPPKYRGLPFSFERSVEGIEEYFSQIFDKEKQYYIGEWHTHPNGSTKYSHTDLNAMIETVDCTTVQITNPVLLILSVNKKNLQDYTFYMYDNKKLIPYE